ncbi:23S rRNA (guanosine(2251)-2'-O)-methyltransferase RlmB [candidate division CPR3 bacterium GWF2_35_18]|uniref:RNA methyltransferase n=1 Tax=candidate division CPR3 bacterium GW2011_GWF2_35_18 TaxID=1618350 RepID=A0A0G0BIT2_UNCC3|nr:MAG: RNA methyltransferase [candidate division CPR3 bacterium GW2011_GWF2_35_18]KKP86957.1 MAG: RNA methyltransferase [candidate division CPR3 bacterium GW2011_GWE2_35_7]OGB62570.1 MAG: 23S rRNA (guanosine(2251)-2'-O)-methyltransferase RlmB [candidate division CPR3 bacterium GWF2_35_18]OGB65821.1 MAG: 23S rRNA (guanosine(2251)-2'-O)-methyltransferase RlmB [candidate division CPR3 bacterium RIFOXYA2_FULL_35_13]OGB79206.1 MAG: 23S rRNA (guanosine(2251)-2'-O)-methyltransferase RlmB [candidate d
MEYLYGRNPVLESLRASRRKFKNLYLSQGVDLKSDVITEIKSLCSSKKIPITPITQHKLEAIVKHRQHQGVVLEGSTYPYVTLDEIFTFSRNQNEDSLVLILDLLQDPQNVGSLLRTAEATGVHGVIIQERRAVGITPSVVNSSSGAAEHLLISQVANISQAIQVLKEKNVWVYGLGGVNEGVKYNEQDLSGPVGVVVGSEGEGLRDLVKKNCDGLISIPMKGKVDSLNATIAGSIILYSIFETRNFK